MEVRNRIAYAALIVSSISLLVAGGSAIFTAKQYRLNEERDQREHQARLPTFEHELTQQREGRQWKLTINVVNRHDAKLTFDFIAIEGPQGAKLALPDGSGGHLNPVGSMPKFVAGVAPPTAARHGPDTS